MQKSLLLVFVFCSTFSLWSQIKGSVTDESGAPIPAATIYIENSYTNTTSNENGFFELNISKTGNYTIVFQCLGFKPEKRSVSINSFPYSIKVSLKEEKYELKEVVLTNKENPANPIIRNAIAAKKNNSEKLSKYTADFYSRGLFRIKDAPKKIMGQDVGDFDGALDASRNGILYLSETVSKLQFQKPDKMKETIVASKVSGKDNGFSFNNAGQVEYDFYENYLPFQVNVISPISTNAFQYYKYELDGVFWSSDKQLINKIKVKPKRDSDPVVEGDIYIVENSWAIYAVDVTLKGYRMQTPIIDTLQLQQNFSYNATDAVWIKNTQSIDFVAGFMGFNVSGKFTYVYSNYNITPIWDKKTFTKEVLSFAKDSNKKEDSFWDAIRPIPLTIEESTDYSKKDSIQTLRKSKKYLDSVDVVKNKFRFTQGITGYTYKNSFQNWAINYSGFLRSVQFNTVQGYHISTGISFVKRNPEDRTYSTFGTNFNYGFSEKKFRTAVYYSQRFNPVNGATLTLNGGREALQFNESKPITPLVNSISTLFFENNYLKLYDKSFVQAKYTQELWNGVYWNAALEYAERKPLFNTTNYVVVNTKDTYFSNNPLAPLNTVTPAIVKHNIVKFSSRFKINFGQEYWTRPDGKFNIPNDKYPTLYLQYDKGFLSNESRYNYDCISSKITKDFSLGNKGILGVAVTSGTFFNANGIAFVDYKHFNGNQTHIGQSDRYLNVFHLLPYYTNSTNDKFAEAHTEYDDKGFLLNKLPLFRALQSSLIVGFHGLALPNVKPYQEVSIGLDNLGFGKLKIFRLDYVRSYQSGYQRDGVVFGLKILNLVD